MYKQNKFDLTKIIFSAMFAAVFFFNVAYAAPEVLNISLKSSHYMQLDKKIARLAVGNSEVATVLQIPGSANEFLIVSKSAGSTNLFVWTADGTRYEYLIDVSPEDRGLARVIQQAIGLPHVQVKTMSDGKGVIKKVLLTGTVRNQYERNLAVQTARLYVEGGSESSLSVGSGFDMSMETQKAVGSSNSITITTGTIGDSEIQSKGEVIDLLHMLHPTQIRLEAQVIAISPQDRESIGIQYGNDPLNAPGVFTVTNTVTSGNFLRHGDWQYSQINLRINALVTQDKAKILSRPSITTMSGEEAVIQVGGLIPYTQYSDNGRPSTEFKSYGIILQLRPVADAEDRITSSLHAEVSNMSGESVDGQPILDVRRADSVVTMRSGSTMVIGGLMDSSERKSVTKFPFLGDIPIIGEFFKYTSKTKDKQELIILVTPYIVEEDELSQTQMSDSMKNFYDEKQEEHNNLNRVDVNDSQSHDEEKISQDQNSDDKREETENKNLVAHEEVENTNPNELTEPFQKLENNESK